WTRADADSIAGASAGSMLGAPPASGVPPWFMVAHPLGETFDEVLDARGAPASEADRQAGAVFRIHRGMPSIGPGSWKFAVNSLRRPSDHTPAAMISAWLPKGVISTEPLTQQ